LYTLSLLHTAHYSHRASIKAILGLPRARRKTYILRNAQRGFGSVSVRRVGANYEQDKQTSRILSRVYLSVRASLTIASTNMPCPVLSNGRLGDVVSIASCAHVDGNSCYSSNPYNINSPAEVCLLHYFFGHAGRLPRLFSNSIP
jgi:hypothetical protein